MSNSGVRTPPSSRPPAKVDDAARGGPARSVADLLPDIGGAAFKRFGFVQSSVVSRWPEIVGERFARVSSPESIKFPHGKRAEGTLTLVVRGAHGVMMQHITPEIIERVNRFFGYQAIARVVLRNGDLSSAPERTPRAAPPSLRPVPTDIGDSLRAIADPEFKAVLEALAAGVAASSGAPRLGNTSGDDA
ncbi:MAG: DUF721 domain-containing protein [Sphingomonas sp.]